MLVALVGIGTIVVVLLGVALVMRFARGGSEDEGPAEGAEFVAPVSSGEYRFRGPEETREEFNARVDAENEEIASRRELP